MQKLTYIGSQEWRGERMRYFNLHLGDKVPTFVVKDGQDIKERMREIQERFAGEVRKAAAA